MIYFEGISTNRYLKQARKENWIDLPFLEHTILELEKLFGSSLNIQKSNLDKLIYILNGEPEGNFLEYFTEKLLRAQDGDLDSIKKIGVFPTIDTKIHLINTKITKITNVEEPSQNYDFFLNLPNLLLATTIEYLNEGIHWQQAIDYDAELKEPVKPPSITNYKFDGRNMSY